VKLVGAVFLVLGVLFPIFTYAGCAIVGLVCIAYLICHIGPVRRDSQGFLAFGLFLSSTVVFFLGNLPG